MEFRSTRRLEFNCRIEPSGGDNYSLVKIIIGLKPKSLISEALGLHRESR